MSTSPMRVQGISLPAMNCHALTGVTMICSMVPASRSLTMASEVSIIVTTMSRSPSTLTGAKLKYRKRSQGGF